MDDNLSHSLSPVRRIDVMANRVQLLLNQDSDKARKYAAKANERLEKLRARYAGTPAPKTKVELDAQQRGIVEARRVELEDTY